MKTFEYPTMNITIFDSSIQLTELSSMPDNAQDNMAVTMYKSKAVSVRAAKVNEIIKMN